MNGFSLLWTVTALAAVLAGCVTESGRRFTPSAEMDASADTYAQCLWDAAMQYDDGTSDPRSIGIGIVPSCAGVFREVLRAASNSLSLHQAALFANNARAQQLDLATAAVVRTRAFRTKNLPSQSPTKITPVPRRAFPTL